MPYVFIVVGLVMLLSGIRGQSVVVTSLLLGDIVPAKGQRSYLYWAFAILLIGGLGYVDDLRPLSRSFLVLMLIVLILEEDQTQTGFFNQAWSELQQITSKQNTASIPSSALGGSSGGAGASGTF